MYTSKLIFMSYTYHLSLVPFPNFSVSVHYLYCLFPLTLGIYEWSIIIAIHRILYNLYIHHTYITFLHIIITITIYLSTYYISYKYPLLLLLSPYVTV